jgi:uncharacterized protein YcbX
MDCRLTGINLYPVKSLGSVAPRRALATELGLDGDRRWVLADRQGRFLSQRSHPSLARLQVARTPEGLVITPDRGSALRLPASVAGPRREITVWRDTVQVVAGPPEAEAWFSDFLEEPCQLAYMDDLCHRPVDLPPRAGSHRVSFADGYPCLLISQASLDLLNSKLDRPVGMDRFRTNLTVAGCAPHDEDRWRRFRVGEAVFRAVKPCSRCQVPTIDQKTGSPSADQEPLRTLATYRNQPKGVMFGVNLVVEKEGWIEVDQPLEFLNEV